MPQRRALLISILFTLLIAAVTIAARGVITGDAQDAPGPTAATTTATAPGQTVTVPLADLITQQAPAGDASRYADDGSDGDDEDRGESNDENDEQEDDD